MNNLSALMTNIGNKIKMERTAKKLSQSELASALGITQDSISLWETGKRLPDTQYIILLCKFFEVSSDYLLGLEE
ncbi:MAG: helix-turn-helix domain-containing protein [Clostridia bacterium]|nr:helix-turn-helix domain-containing protein [Clostridia bacterium]